MKESEIKMVMTTTDEWFQLDDTTDVRVVLELGVLVRTAMEYTNSASVALAFISGAVVEGYRNWSTVKGDEDPEMQYRIIGKAEAS